MNDVWPTVHAERAALVRDLEGLDDPDWDAPSLCSAWSVHDVVAHLVDTARTTRTGFVLTMLRARGDFHRHTARGVQRQRGATPGETLERLRAAVPLTSTPPAPLESRLAEAVLHGEDIRRPLGLAPTYPRDAVVRSLRLQARTPATFGGAKERVAGLRLRATDADLVLGDGPEVAGPVLSLLLVACGRSVAVDDLDGAGVDALAGRP